ncbi:threonine aldolase family protein [Cognatishimia maritima]|uniref:L-threonine aldolase n=1 Tax=Cognatishimia maritima TaxID=870908 RepID=A0A1M5KRG2_9RHOB|nr:beta-eliminating lyase-related protein [Cognatishimia maritima]SHG55351.1 L-threonine aldolase [Cognatishimia maritima]
MHFASDNAGIAHPTVIQAIVEANEGYALGYGQDDLTKAAVAQVRAAFEAPEAAVYFLPTGTAANALALACLTRPYETIFCAPMAHIQEDECGAPEFFSGAKLTLVGTEDKITPKALRAAIDQCVTRGFQGVRPGALSLSQVTEFGQVYTLDEIRALTEIAHKAGIPTHMDGARFAHACVALGVSAAEMSRQSGIDAVSFGATKNGCLGVEAMVLFDPARADELEARRKRGGHLLSKQRFLSAQMLAYLIDDLWLTLASQANVKAAALAKQLSEIDGVSLAYPCEANMIFAHFSRPKWDTIKVSGAKVTLVSEESDQVMLRLVCDWALPEDDIERFLKLLR